VFANPNSGREVDYFFFAAFFGAAFLGAAFLAAFFLAMSQSPLKIRGKLFLTVGRDGYPFPSRPRCEKTRQHSSHGCQVNNEWD
jgi:hypothetical protein